MNLDDIYKSKFKDYEASSSLDWGSINSKLKRKDFVRFNPMRFNLYYLLILISFSAFSSYSVVKNHILKTENKNLVKKVTGMNRSIDSLQNTVIYLPATINDQMELLINKNHPEIIGKGIRLKDIPLIIDADTLRNMQPAVADTVTVNNSKDVQQKLVRKIKRTVVVKQNVVVKKDSLKELQ